MDDQVVRTLDFTPAWDPVPMHEKALWPPRGHRGDYNVANGEQDWVYAASVNRIGDVRDLIFFNFRTLNPRRINWYLHHYVGCWRSKDRKNFDFKDAKPGKIFLPPFGWTRRNAAIPLQDLIYSELLRAAPRYPRKLLWNKYNIKVSRTKLEYVAEEIKNGHISVEKNSKKLNEKDAVAYFYVNSIDDVKVITLRDGWSAGNLSDMFSLIHEAGHAIMFYLNGRIVSEVVEEIMTRSASEIWLYRTNEDAWRGKYRFQDRRTGSQIHLGRLLAQTKGSPKNIDFFDKIMAHDTKNYDTPENFVKRAPGIEHYNVVEKLRRELKRGTYTDYE